jgi:hypothetical protein
MQVIKNGIPLDIKEMSYNSTVTPIYKNLDDLYGFQLANSKEAMAKFFEDALIGYSIAHCESFLKKVKSEIKSNDNSKLPPKRVLISIKECFIEKDGPKCFEKVVQKLSQRLEIVNDHLVIKSLERRIKVGTLLAEVSGLYRFLVDEDLVMRDESLRDVFLTEFKLRSSLYNKKCFQPGKTSNNPKVDMWKGLYRSKKTH